MSTLIDVIRAKPSTNADGLTEAEYTGHKKQEQHGLLVDFFSQAREGRLGKDAATALQALQEMSGGEPLDDRKLLLEHGVSLLQHLPPGSDLVKHASETVIKMFYNDLPHPPVSAVGIGAKYRSADGSNNNVVLPNLGKSGQPYARSVPPVRPKPTNLPDPGLIFDQLLRRQEFKPHPSGISALFFAFATIVIHECFATNSKDWAINDTTSYVDLSTLYGNNQAEQDRVRDRNGAGLLYPDAVSSTRIFMMPPASGTVLILFSRNHNHIASRLLQVNEGGQYSEDLDSLSSEQRKKQDEDIFQLARNINVGWFASVVLGDYVATILNTHRANSEWTLDLGGEIRNADGSRVPRGGGNTVSVEFNVLYRWHASLSEHDAAWITSVMDNLLPGQDISNISPADFGRAASIHAATIGQRDPRYWTMQGYSRGPDNKYADGDLANILKDATEHHAGAFGANGTPAALKVIEVMGQLMARNSWQVCTMNEFRTYLNLTPFKSFEEWNSDPAVAQAASTLYGGHIDDLELYPGLLAEEAKPAMGGSGVCPGHTIGRAILNDAVQLIRSDRFLTHDFNTSTLTSWGSASLKAAPGALNGYFPSMLFTLLPGAYKFNSTYAMLPFYTPAAAREILTGNGVMHLYSNERAPSDGRLRSLQSFDACKAAFNNRDTFRTLYNDAIKTLFPAGFLIGFDDRTRHDPPAIRMLQALHPPGFAEQTREFFAEHINYQVKKMSLADHGTVVRRLDIVRDVCNIVPIEWIAHRFALPIKRVETPHGLFTVQELRMMLLGLFVYTSFNIIPKAGWFLRETSLKSAAALVNIISTRITTASGWRDTAINFLAKGTSYEESSESETFYKFLQSTDIHPDQLAGDTIGIMVPIAGNLTQQVALLTELYLRPEYDTERKAIVELCKAQSPRSDHLLMGYIREGMRIAPVVIGLPRLVAFDTTIQDGDKEVHLKAGDKIIIGISKAHMDEVAFPNPELIDPTRKAEDYMLYGSGLHVCLGLGDSNAALLASIRAIFSLKNLRRAPGKAGRFTRVTEDLGGLDAHLYIDQNGTETPAPVSLQVLYDAESVNELTGAHAVATLKLKTKPSANLLANGANGTTDEAGLKPSSVGEKSLKKKPSFFGRLRRDLGGSSA